MAFAASQGPRVLPGTYTVRLTKGAQVIETKLEIGLDRRAPFKLADRRQQFDAAMRVHALFGDMSALVDRIQAARAGAEVVEGKVVDLRKTSDDAFELRAEDGKSFDAKQVILTLGANAELARQAGIATKPGTEPRIREIVDVDREGRTSVPGVWAAGTIAGVSVHTIITAGDGARVAINLISQSKGERHVDHDVLPRPAEAAAG